MSVRERKNFGPPPVEHVELEQTHPKRRLAAVIVLLVVGLGALGFAFRTLIRVSSGWVEILTNEGQAENCSVDFQFRYRLGKDSTAEYRAVTLIYTDASREAYRLFHPTKRFEELDNLAVINQHPNEAVHVEPALCEALALMERFGDRSHLLGPLYAQYDAIFRSFDDEEAALYDPALSEEAAEYLDALLPLLLDADQLSLELLGEDRVCLHVGEELLDFAGEHGIENYVDFYWLKNAFILDYIAGKLQDAGMTNGYLVSLDGFGCCLDETQERYSLRVTEMDGETLTNAAEFYYTGPLCLADLHRFAQSSGNDDNYYVYPDRTVTPFLSPDDGREHSAMTELAAVSRTKGCAELLLSMRPLYVADRFDHAAADALSAEDIGLLGFDGGELYENETALALLKPAS